MAADFVLERLVHHVLRGDGVMGKHLICEMLGNGTEPKKILGDVLWPTVECLGQLRADGAISKRTYNMAARVLGSLIDLVGMHFPRVTVGAEATLGRRIMVIGAPGDADELGSQLLATLAEGHGFTVFYAGNGLSVEEITFAIGQLSPDALVVCGSKSAEREGARRLCLRLQGLKVWPAIQLVVVGAVLGQDDDALGADLMGRNPQEALELMALCPEYRSRRVAASFGGSECGAGLKMLKGSAGLGMEEMEDMVVRQYLSMGGSRN